MSPQDLDFLLVAARYIEEETDRFFTLDSEPLDIVEFVKVNFESFQWDTFLRAFSLKQGETITFGGGAQAVSTLKRIH